MKDKYWERINKKNLLLYSAYTDARYKIVLQELCELLKGTKGNDNSLLDMGCGQGVLLYLLSKLNFSLKLYALDLSSSYIRTTKKYLEKKRNIESYSVIGCVSLAPYGNESFNYIVSTDVIEHLEKPEDFIEEVWRLLKPKGYFVIGTPIKSKEPLSNDHIHEFQTAELEKLLKRYFNIVNSIHFGNLSLYKKLGNTPMRVLINTLSIVGYNPFFRQSKKKNMYMIYTCQKIS